MLEVGETAPDFTLPDHDGNPVRLSELREKTVVLFFYPRAATPGCTIEACSFRDAGALFAAAGIVLLGISPDAPEAQGKFANKFGLTMPLLADTDHVVAELYGVWVEKSMYGKKYMGVSRETFVVGPEGKIIHIFRKVKPDGHAGEVLARITGAGGPSR